MADFEEKIAIAALGYFGAISSVLMGREEGGFEAPSRKERQGKRDLNSFPKLFFLGALAVKIHLIVPSCRPGL